MRKLSWPGVSAVACGVLGLATLSCGSDKPASHAASGGDTSSAGSSSSAGNTATGGSSTSGTGGQPAGATAVVVSPASPHLTAGATVQFSASVKGTVDNTVTWAVKEAAAGGSVDAKGLYTAPAKDGTYHVTATTAKKETGEATVFVSTPSNCDALDASGKMGWENIMPSGLTDSTGLTVDPFDPATVWVGGHGGLFKSTNCGATWTLMSTGKGADPLNNSSLWSLAIDPVDKGTIYLVGAYGGLGLWKSTDGGVNFEQLFPPDSEWAKTADQNFVNNVSMDPNDHLHLVVTQHGTCKGYTTACEAESKDGGKNWKLTAGPKGWGEGGGAQIINATSWIWGGAQGFSGLHVTTDNGASWKEVLGGGKGDANGEFTTRPLAPVADGAYYITAMQGVLRSTDGLAWSSVGMGRLVGIAFSKKSIFVSDQWSPTFQKASFDDPMTWTKIDPPASIGSGAGCPYLDYDQAHKVLYASCFKEGTFRIVTE